MLNQNALFLTHQIRESEHYAKQNLGLTDEVLMLRAGFAAFSCLKQRYSKVQHIAVMCGGGNNGGDGFALACFAQEAGLYVRIYCSKPLEELTPAVRKVAYRAVSKGADSFSLDDIIDDNVELIVDALLGIGITGELQEPLAFVINFINEAKLPIFSIDVPSGLNADTGHRQGPCILADATITFIAKKLGLYQGDGPDCCGTIILDDLQLSELLPELSSATIQLDESLFYQALAPRVKNTHKGMFGHVLVVGGNLGMPGAPVLAANAAMRVGAGTVTIATHPSHACGALENFPEAMILGVETPSDLMPLFEQATVCILGPGLGCDEWAKAMFSCTISQQLPLVMDASALQLLAVEYQHDENWVLTPHPGEAAKLLGCSTDKVQEDRLDAVRSMQHTYGGVVVLKGMGTLIASHDNVSLCALGNAGMSSAGVGDVLSGVIGGLLAQGVNLVKAAQLGVWLHAKAGDDATLMDGTLGLLASDLMIYLRKHINLLMSG